MGNPQLTLKCHSCAYRPVLRVPACPARTGLLCAYRPNWLEIGIGHGLGHGRALDMDQSGRSGLSDRVSRGYQGQVARGYQTQGARGYQQKAQPGEGFFQFTSG